jgi:hypothetical protein
MSPVSSRLIKCFTFFSLIHLNLIHLLETDDSNHRRQSVDYLNWHGRQTRPASGSIIKLGWMKTLAVWYNRFHVAVHLYNIVQNIVTQLLKFQIFKELAMIDCIPTGRAAFGPRFQRNHQSFGLAFHIVLLLLRYYMRVLVSCKFPVFEFLLQDYDTISEQEMLAASKTSELDSTPVSRPGVGHGKIATLDDNDTLQRPPGLDTTLGRSRQTTRPLMYIESSCNLDDGTRAGSNLILRPNRTAASWLALNKSASLAAYCSIYYAIGFLTFLSSISLGTTLSVFGFEVTYSSCVAWIERLQARQHIVGQSLSYSYIHADKSALNKTLAYEISLDATPMVILFGSEHAQLPPLNVYHLFRLSMDLFQTCYLSLACAANCSAIIFVLYMIADDVAINARQVSERLAKLIASLQHLINRPSLTFEHDFQCRFSGCRTIRPNIDQADYSPTFKHAHRESIIIQEILFDHFKLIQQYNIFVSYILLMGNLLLFSVSFVMVNVILTNRKSRLTVEFYVFELSFLGLVMIYLASLARVRRYQCSIYRLISRAMALDTTTILTKKRWIVILRCYIRPKQMHCFKVFGLGAEISWLFCLKVQ